MNNAVDVNLVLWQQPFKTCQYALLELFLRLQNGIIILIKCWKVILPIFVMLSSTVMLNYVDGYHKFVQTVNDKLLSFAYWLGLGILSSIGLGTGLHTFVLYLGPFIGSVTLAGWECHTVEFPKPPYPNELLCPSQVTGALKQFEAVAFWLIYNKVKFESLIWGIGTAIGELPPYFMAKAARLSNDEFYEYDENFSEYEILSNQNRNDMTKMERIKAAMLDYVRKTGFWGILLFASVPNPLFDLAGFTCGHCLIPFKTFFIATVIGKAFIKTTIQVSFVIICFSPTYVYKLLILLDKLPIFGHHLKRFFSASVEFQRMKFHKLQNNPNGTSKSSDWISWIFEKFILCTVLYFLVSIINSMAQMYVRRYKVASRILESSKNK